MIKTKNNKIKSTTCSFLRAIKDNSKTKTKTANNSTTKTNNISSNNKSSKRANNHLFQLSHLKKENDFDFVS